MESPSLAAKFPMVRIASESVTGLIEKEAVKEESKESITHFITFVRSK